MFALIITLISLVLVVALAVAVIYYGGEAITRSRTNALAATLVTQGQQILGATEVFKVQRGRWPASAQELIDAGLLSGMPQAPKGIAALHPGDVSLIQEAHAQTLPEWRQVTPSAPQFWLLRGTSEAVCKAINKKVRGDDGIYNAASRKWLVQCFGTEANYTVLLHLSSPNDPTTDIGTTVPSAGGTPTLIVNDDGGGWAVEPSDEPSPTTPETPAPDESAVPSPVLSSLAPTSGSPSGGTLITLTGTGFTNASRVLFNGVEVATTYVSATELRVSSPAGAAGATAPISVTNPTSSGGKTSAPAQFTYSDGSLTGTATVIPGAQAHFFTVGADSKTLYGVTYEGTNKFQKFIDGAWVTQTLNLTDPCPDVMAGTPRDWVDPVDVSYEKSTGKTFVSTRCRSSSMSAWVPYQIRELDVSTMSATAVYTSPQPSNTATFPGKLTSGQGFVWMSIPQGDTVINATTRTAYSGLSGISLANSGDPVIIMEALSASSYRLIGEGNQGNFCYRGYTTNGWQCNSMSTALSTTIGWDRAPNGNLYWAYNKGIFEFRVKPAADFSTVGLEFVKTIIPANTLNLANSFSKLVVAPDGTIYISDGSVMYHIE